MEGRTEGTSVIASLEGGYPFRLSPNWSLEPEAQIVAQRIDFDRTSDAFAAISFDRVDLYRGRLGVRLAGDYQTRAGVLQPFAEAHLWRTFAPPTRSISTRARSTSTTPRRSWLSRSAWSPTSSPTSTSTAA